MSADDFQNKYASVMESMLRTAVAETTKIFETMVDELREEISSIRKENEELKIRCSRFEKTENKSAAPVGDNNNPSVRSVSSKKRDSSVQCDLVNLHVVPVEPCQPLQDHQYTIPPEQNAQMRFSLLQQEEESSRICSESEFEQAEVELCVVSSPALEEEASVGAENEDSWSIDECSSDELVLCLSEESRGSNMAETSDLREDEDSPSVFMQSPFANIDRESETDLKISETRTQAELQRSEKPQLVTCKLTHGSRLNSEDVCAREQQSEKPFEINQEDMCEEVKLCPVQCGRRGPTKTRKCRGLPLSSSDCSSNQEQSGPTSIRDDDAEKSLTFDSGEILSSESPPASSPNNSPVASASESKQPVVEVEDEPTQAESPENASAITSTTEPGTLPPASEQPREKIIYACCQDTTEAVKATSQSLTSPPKTSSTETEWTAIGTPNKLNAVSSCTVIVVPRTKSIDSQNSSVSDIELSIVSPTTPQDEPQPSTTLVPTSGKCLPPSDCQKTIDPTNAKLLPVVSLLSSSTSKVQQPVTCPNQQEKDLFQQKVLALASRQSQMNMKGRQQIIKLPVVISQPLTKLKPTSMGSSVGASSDTSEKLENLKKAASPSSTCSESNTSTKLVPASILFVPPNVKENLFPMVSLPRLPFSVTTSKSVSVSRLSPIGSSKYTQMKPLISPVSFSGMLSLPSNMSPTGSARTSMIGSVDNLGQLKGTQEQASVPLESSTDFNETQPSASSDVSAQASVKSKEDGNIVEESSELTQDEEPAPSHCEGITNTKEQESKFCDILQLVPVTPTESSNPHPHMTKCQFLAQLAVLPKIQVQEKAISSTVRKTRASSKVDSIMDKDNLQRNQFLSQLHSYHKTYLLTKKAETKLKASTTSKHSSLSSRKRRLSDIRSCETTTNDLLSVCPKKQAVLDDATNTVSSPPSTFSHANEGGQSQEDVGPKTTNCEPTLTSLVKSGSISDGSKTDDMDIQEDPLETHGRTISPELSPSIIKPKQPSLLRCTPSTDCMISENKKSSSASQRNGSSTEKNAGIRKTKVISVSPDRSIPGQEGICSKECNSVSPSRSTSFGNGACPKELSSVSPKRSTSSEDSAHSQDSSSVSASKSTSDGDDACSERSSPVSLRGSNSEGDRLQSKECGSVVLTRSSSGEHGAHCTESSSVSPKMSSPGGDGAHCKKSSSVSPNMSSPGGDGGHCKESSSVSPKMSSPGGDVVHCKESSSVSLKMSSPGGDGAHCKKSSSVSPKMSSPGGDGGHCKESSSVSPKMSSPGGDGAHCKESSSVSPKMSSPGGDVVHCKESNSVSPKMSSPGGDGAHCKKSSSVSPNMSSPGGDGGHCKDSSSVSPKMSSPGGDGAHCKESSSVSPNMSSPGGDGGHCKDSSSVSPKMSSPGGDGAHCKNSSSVRTRRSTLSGSTLLSKESSLRRSTSGQASLSCKDSSSPSTRSISGKASARSEDSICVNTRRSTSGRTSVCSKESSSLSPRESISGRADVSSVKSSCKSSRGTSRGDVRHSKKYSPVSLERSTSTYKTLSSKITETVGTPKRAKSFLMRSRRLSEEATPSEKSLTACTCSKMSELSEISSSLEMSCSCGSTSSKDCPEKESSSVSLEMCGVNGANVPTESSIGDIDSTNVLWSEIDKNGISSQMAKAHTAKKPRIDKDIITPEKTMSTWMLASGNEAQTVAELKNWKSTKLEVSMSQNKAYSDLKRWKTKGVWVPPTLPPGEVPHGDIEKMAKSKNTSAKPKPVRPVGIVSPLQPLSVIGKFTLRNQCGQCGRTFTNNVALENHVSLHKKRRPFSCSLCGKSFPDARAFKRHDRVHRNGKIHICPQCGKGFVYNFYLTKHIQMVHSKVRSVFCPMCNKGFFSQREVDIHVRSHTGEKPFPCTLCDRKFSTRVKLNVHLRWHKGEKRHWCTYCTKGFLDYNNLKRHLLVHTGEKPYSCPLCSKCFSQTGHLKKHVANVHKAK